MIKGRSALDSLLEHGLEVVNKPVQALSDERAVVNTVVNSRSKDRHNKEARREYMRNYMSRKRAEGKNGADSERGA